MDWSSALAGSEIYVHEPLAKHTTFKVGGPCDCLLMLKSQQELQHALAVASQAGEQVTIMGNGSNMLVGDGGIKGLVIKIGDGMKALVCQGTTIHAEAGASLKALANCSLEHGLTGLEFAAGIPGYVGGAVAMNAGAYDGEMKLVVASLKACTLEGELSTYTNEQLAFGYRTSLIKQEGWVVLSVEFSLTKGDPVEIKEKIDEYTRRRVASQPLQYPSAGSVFKRPEGFFAGKLIEEAGLKGYSIGGAQVSTKHAGFIVNTGDATAADINALIQHIQQTVFSATGVYLEPEVRRVGDA